VKIVLRNPFVRPKPLPRVVPESLQQSMSAKAVESDMSTAAVVVPVVKKMTFLQHAGSILRKILHIGEDAAIVASPFISIAFPSIAPLYNSAIGLAEAAEGTAASAIGTGAEKLASVVASLLPLAEKFAVDNNLVFDQAGLEKWASVVADSLNLFPFTPNAPTAGLGTQSSTGV
jgi:hypothetical protein